MTGELRSLTTARGFAAWLVVLYHVRSGMDWASPTLMAVLDKGYLAVDFFFLLSGFVIYLSAHRSILRDRTAAIIPFLTRRLARVYPLYAVMLGLAVLFAASLAWSGHPDANYPWAELPLHIMMMQNWGLTEALSWNHPAWSISTEFAAYLLFPLLILAAPIDRARRPNLLAGMMLVLALMHFTLALSGETTLGGDIPRYGLVRCLAEFSCGVLLCAFWLRGPDREPRSILVAGLGVLMFWGLWATGIGQETWAFPAGAACLVLMLAHLSLLQRNPLHWRPLVFLGTISYATYLFHYMGFIWFKIVLIDDAGSIPPTLIALFLLLTFGASVALHLWVEKPGRRWGRGLKLPFRERLLPRRL